MLATAPWVCPKLVKTFLQCGCPDVPKKTKRHNAVKVSLCTCLISNFMLPSSHTLFAHPSLSTFLACQFLGARPGNIGSTSSAPPPTSLRGTGKPTGQCVRALGVFFFDGLADAYAGAAGAEGEVRAQFI